MPTLSVIARDSAGHTAAASVPFTIEQPPTGVALLGSSRVADLPSFVTKVDVTRVYQASSWTKTEIVAGLNRGCKAFVLSTKTTDTARLRSFLRAKPADVTVYMSYYHEHEGNLRDRSLTLAQYEAGSQAIARVCHEFNNVLYGPMHNGNNPRPGGGWEVGGWVDVADTSIYDFWGADCYCPDYEEPAVRFAPLVAKAASLGLPLVIGETGAVQGTRQPGWCTQARTWARNNGVVACYWHSQTSSSAENWRLSDESARHWFFDMYITGSGAE